MLFPGKKCHNSVHQPVVLGIVAFFVSHVNKASIMLQSSSPSLISLSVSQTTLLLFLMPYYYRYNFYLPQFANFCDFILQLTIICEFFFSFPFNASVKWHTGSISMYFLFFLSITVISSRLCSRVLSVCIGKSHKILQISDSKTFSGLCIYHLPALLKRHFSISFQEAFWQRCHVSLVCTPSVLFLSILKQYAQLFHQQHHIHDRLIEHFLRKPHFSNSLYIGPGLVLLQ